MEEHENRDPIILTSPARMLKGILIIGITLAVCAAILVTNFNNMIANPPPVSRVKPPTTTPTEQPPAEAGVTTITMLLGASVQGSPAYSPADAQVPLGNKLVWKNGDTQFHTATSGTGPEDPEHGKLFDTGLVNAGNSSKVIELANAKVGDVINFYCFVHPFMHGKITIVAAASGAQGTGNVTAGGSQGAGNVTAGPTLAILEGAVNQGAPDFNPDSLTVKKGDKITVVNQDTTIHTVTNGADPQDPNMGKLFDTKFLESKKSAVIDTANLDPGSYAYFCQVHPYMKGTLVVQ